MNTPKQEPDRYIYVGRASCGCCTAVVSDYGDEETANDVAEIIKSGFTIERVSFARYLSTTVKEPTYLNCPHTKAAGEQS